MEQWYRDICVVDNIFARAIWLSLRVGLRSTQPLRCLFEEPCLKLPLYPHAKNILRNMYIARSSIRFY